jgi:hypothetical protein
VVFTVFRLLTEFVCLLTYEFLPFHLEDCSVFGNFVIAYLSVLRIMASDFPCGIFKRYLADYPSGAPDFTPDF